MWLRPILSELPPDLFERNIERIDIESPRSTVNSTLEVIPIEWIMLPKPSPKNASGSGVYPE